MDMSAFNLLMSTTPNAANATDGGNNAALPTTAGTTRESLRTGEAFMQVLKTVGTRRTEQNADSFFTSMNARAHANSFKDFKTGDGVKVVKITLKRTRACEKTEEPQPQKQPSETRAFDDRQKIPAAENTAFVPVETNDNFSAAPVLTIETAENDFCAPTLKVDDKKETFDTEQTAADVLIGAAMQAVAAPVAMRETTPVSDEVEVGFAPDDRAAPIVENDAEQPARDTFPLPENQADAPVEIAPERRFVPAETMNAPVESAKPVEAGAESFASATAIPTQKKPESGKIETVADFVSNDGAKETDLPVQSVRRNTETTVKTVAISAPEHAETAKAALPEPIGFDNRFETTAVDPAARRQAREIARQLPTDVTVNISVETRTVESAVETAASVKPEKNSRTIRAEQNEEANAPVAPFDDIAFGADTRNEPFETGKQPVKTAVSRAETQEDAPIADDVFTPVFTAGKTQPVETANGGSAVDAADGVSPNGAKTEQAFIVGDKVLRGKSAVTDVKASPKTVFTREMADTVKINIQKALKTGLDKIDVVLKTKDLGTVKIHLDIDKDGNMKAVISTARADTLDLLRADLSGLKQALADSGFNMNDQAFAFNYRGERFDDGDRDQSRRFADDDGADGEADETAAVTTENSGRYALNIKV